MRTPLIAISICLSLCLHAGQWALAQIDEDAAAVVEKYADAITGFSNIQARFELYTCLYPSFINSHPPARVGLYPLRKFGQLTFELDKRGVGCIANGLQHERYEVEKVGPAGAKGNSLIISFAKDRIFTYDPDARSGLQYSPDDTAKNHLYSNGAIGNQLGKRANNGPMIDLVDLLRQAEELKIENQTQDEVTVYAKTPSFRSDVRLQLFIRATFHKQHGYMPSKWEVGQHSWKTRFQAAENSQFVKVDGVWLPTMGFLHTFGSDKREGQFVEICTGTNALIVDPASIKVNQRLPEDYFSPALPVEAVVLDEVSGKLYDSRHGSVTTTAIDKSGPASLKLNLAWQVAGVALLIGAAAAVLLYLRLRS